jgi:hypothetical protein
MRVNKRLRSLVESSWRDSALKRGLLEDEQFWSEKGRDWKWIVRSKKVVKFIHLYVTFHQCIFPEHVQKSGVGCFSTGSDRRYEGEWVNDKREGNEMYLQSF